MEPLLKVAWALLALVHAVPAAALVAPGALRRLYGIEPGGELAVLLTHRGALFLALTVLGAFAAVDPAVRRVAGSSYSLHQSGRHSGDSTYRRAARRSRIPAISI